MLFRLTTLRERLTREINCGAERTAWNLIAVWNLHLSLCFACRDAHRLPDRNDWSRERCVSDACTEHASRGRVAGEAYLSSHSSTPANIPEAACNASATRESSQKKRDGSGMSWCGACGLGVWASDKPSADQRLRFVQGVDGRFMGRWPIGVSASDFASPERNRQRGMTRRGVRGRPPGGTGRRRRGGLSSGIRRRCCRSGEDG